MACTSPAWIILIADLALSETALLKGDFDFGDGPGTEWTH